LHDSQPEQLTWGQFLRGYLALLVTVIAFAILLERWSGTDPYRTTAVACGPAFCLAALGRPPRLYLIVRNTGWFALVRDELVMRLLLGVIGVVAVWAGMFLPATQLQR
jgi:hypothetical protein